MRILLKVFFLICTFYLLIGNVSAQGERFFSSGRDITSSLVNNIYQDSDGMIWVSTEDGLNVYNGVSFRHIRNVLNDTTSLANNFVRFVFQDKCNDIFVATISGLQYFDRATQDYINIPVYTATGNRLQGVSISSYCQVNDSLVLLGSSGFGLFKLKKLGPGRYEMILASTVNKGYVERIAKGPDGCVWVSYYNDGIIKFDEKLNLVDIVDLGIDETAFAICHDHKGNLFFGTSKGRVLLYDPTLPGKYREIVTEQQNFYRVLDFYVDDNNLILFGTDGAGLKYLQADGSQNWTLHDYVFASIDNKRLKVHDIMLDNFGNFWFAIFQRGILVRPTENYLFEYIGSKSYLHNVIGDCCVMSLAHDSKRNLYVGTDSDGIYVLDPNNKPIAHWQHDSPNSLIPNVTLSIFEDSRHRIWLGGYLSGLVYYDPQTNKFNRYPLLSTNKGDQLPSVYSIVEDTKTGNIWASASGVGLFKINSTTLQSTQLDVKSYTLLNDFSQNQITNVWINCMYISSDRKLYIGTYSGFNCMDLDTENFVNTYGVNCFLEGSVVNSIYEDINRHIWIGTSNGLFDFDTKNRTFKEYGVEEGMPSSYISGLAGDKDGNIWFSTNGGISCFDRQSGIFVNFYASDGLYSNEFSHGAVCISDKGKLSFGSSNGVVCFFPFKGRQKSRQLSITLTNFIVNGRSTYLGARSGDNLIMDTVLYHARHFHIAHFDNLFEVEFSATDCGNPESLVFNIRTDGGPWSVISGNHVTFANLDCGRHVIEAYVTDNVTISKPLVFTVDIDFPWYRSWWFFTLITIVVIAILLTVVMVAKRRSVLNEQIKQMSHIKEINDSRLEYFTNISHEIRTPMSLIVSPLYKLMNTDPDRERQRSYKIINVNAQRVLNLINQLMDLRKIDSAQMNLKFQEVDIVAFLRSIYESFEIHASQLGVDFGFDYSIKSLPLYIDPLNFDKVIVNILSNAFKYTPKGRAVTMQLTQPTDTEVEIVVQDNGTGLPEQDLDHIFDLFYQGDNSHKISIVGTGVGMYLTKQLVEMHHGKIVVHNNIDGTTGCTFRILLPLGRAHLQDSQIIAADDSTNIQAKNSAAANLANIPIDEEFLKQYSKTKFRIMVVDDDDHVRNYLVAELAPHFHVSDFSNGDDAWKYAVKNKPDLIVSDVMMGEMSGLALCKKIKQNLEVNHIPVILLTALAQDENRIKGLDVGADAFLAKPFNISVLIHTITNLLKKNISLKNRYQGRQEQTRAVEEAQVDIKSPDERLLQRVMKVINENISNPSLTVEMIASQVGISRVHLHRKLKELTNQSTLDFLRNVRLNLAVKLLEKRHHSILEVAQQVGFVSTAYFSTVFKDRFGMTPTAYMNQHAPGSISPEDLLEE